MLLVKKLIQNKSVGKFLQYLVAIEHQMIIIALCTCYKWRMPDCQFHADTYGILDIIHVQTLKPLRGTVIRENDCQFT